MRTFVFDLAMQILGTTPASLSPSWSGADGEGVLFLPNFGIGSAALTPYHTQALDGLLDYLVADPSIMVTRIEGRASLTGSSAANEDLSILRGETVRAYLSERGLAVQRIQGVEGLGTSARFSEEAEHPADRSVLIRYAGQSAGTSLAPPSFTVDPGSLMRTVSLSELKPADIVLTTTDAPFPSGTIKLLTGAKVSHAVLYAGDGEFVEAVLPTVRRISLSGMVSEEEGYVLAVVLRHPGLTPTEANEIVSFVESKIGTPFAGVGMVAGNPAHQSAFELCQALVSDPTWAWLPECEALVPDVSPNWFCSELVADGFRHAGKPLSDTPSHLISPDVILGMPGLEYVGHLIGEDI